MGKIDQNNKKIPDFHETYDNYFGIFVNYASCFSFNT